MKLIKKTRNEIINDKYRSYGLFKCPECNIEVEKRLDSGKKQKSCGCIYNNIPFKKIHGERINGTKPRLYRIWEGMKCRCYNKKYKGYKRYGNRGIEVYKEWKNNYVKFKRWSLDNGYNDNLQIDRIDNDGNYEPLNCRFVTPKENMWNSSSAKLNIESVIEIRNNYKSKINTRKELANIYDVSHQTINDILANRTWKE